MSRILVVGGAKYIGSHMMKALTKSGHETIAFDNLLTGHADAVIRGELAERDLANRDQIIDDAWNFDSRNNLADGIARSRAK